MAGISDKEVRSLIARAQAEGRTVTQADGLIPGLTLTASKAGAGSWVLRYWIGGKRKEVTIGQFPVWGAADAREKAKYLRRAVDDGADVAIQKKVAKQAVAEAWTVDDLAESYFEKAEKDLAPHTLNMKKGRYDRYIKSMIGNLRADSILPKNIVVVMEKAQLGGVTLPRLVLIDLSVMFGHAVARGVCITNPCRDLTEVAVVGKAPAPNSGIALDAKELSAFLPALKLIPRPYELVIRLMLLTGVRVGTITEAEWSEFDLDIGVWSIPHKRRKNRRHTVGPFEIKLPAGAMSWVNELHQLADGGVRLLPVELRRGANAVHTRGKRNVIGDWLDRMHAAGDGEWRRITPHDLRRTCRTALSAIGIEEIVAEKYLDHADGALVAKYDKWTKSPERAVASEKLLEYLLNCEQENKK